MSTLSKADAYTRMWTLAQARRGPNESPQQAFAKFAGTVEGQELMAAQKPDLFDLAERRAVTKAALDVSGSSATTPVTKSAPAQDLWDALVRGYMRMEKRDDGKAIEHISQRERDILQGRAIEKLLATPEGRALHEFPHMSESTAMDHVRSTPDGHAAWMRYKTKPGAAVLPQGQSVDDGSVMPTVPTTSGRADPPRVSQWDSPHSGSRYTPPSGAPWSAPEAPAIKHWLNLVKRMEFNCGFSRERSIEILKVLDHGKKAFERAVAEAASL